MCMYVHVYACTCMLTTVKQRQTINNALSSSPSTADRAKSIKTRATVNESATDKLIRELREENARLMEMLKKMDLGVGPQMSQEQGASEEGGPYALAVVQMYVCIALFACDREFMFAVSCL